MVLTGAVTIGGELAPGEAGDLERSCSPGRDWVQAAPPWPGLDRIDAWFADQAYEPHRHDTYALGVTIAGVQRFHYRGAPRHSLPGQVIVLHPDELHDGAAGSAAGLRYRMMYVEPRLVAEALGGRPLPFVASPVLDDATMAHWLLAALDDLDQPLDDLLAQEVLAQLAEALAKHAGAPVRRPSLLAWRQVRRMREMLDAATDGAVRAADLEAATGLDRYEAARQFRRALGTSPHRYLTMRRLAMARRLIERGGTLADVAAETGFADQSHLTRQFKKAFGTTPGRWSALVSRRDCRLEAVPAS